MAKIIPWTPEQTKINLATRLENARNERAKMEQEWKYNERTIYSTTSDDGIENNVLASDGNGSAVMQSNTDSAPSYTINYAFKNFRLLHSQLASNPPSAVPRPTSSDPSDRRKADAADRAIRYGGRQYSFKEVHDQTTLLGLLHGTAWIKGFFDTDKGDITSFNAATGEVETEGDMHFAPRSVWDLLIDPDAKSWGEVNWVFDRICLSYEEACFRFPDKHELLEKLRNNKESSSVSNYMGKSEFEHVQYDVIEVYQYWEKGAPHTGYVGRFCWCLPDGTPLTDVVANPARYGAPVSHGIDHPENAPSAKTLPAKAQLPFNIFTDVDVPNTPYGKSSVSYQAPLQSLHNDILNSSIDMMQAHGVARLILPEGAELASGSVTNSAWDIVKYTGVNPPSFMEPMPMPSCMPELLAQAKTGVDDMAGVNESMFGQQSREQSGFSMQYATQQGNMIRYRLFVKYAALVEAVYKCYLNMIKKYWTVSKTIHVLGKEKAFEAFDLKGADIDGGFDLIVEYGTSLSLDPVARQQQLIQMMPMLKEAGMDIRTILGYFRLSEIDSLVDRVSMADDRQREIFEKMIHTNVYIKPRELQDHKNMLAYAYTYIMSSEYTYLDDESKKLIEDHIKEREQLAAQGPAAQATQPDAALGGATPEMAAAAPQNMANAAAGALPPTVAA